VTVYLRLHICQLQLNGVLHACSLNCMLCSFVPSRLGGRGRAVVVYADKCDVIAMLRVGDNLCSVSACFVVFESKNRGNYA
jgi:hypothetical protein